MHSDGIFHRDLKPENLLLDSEGNLKIADFGFATEKTISKEYIGTQQYMSPEMYSKIQEYAPEKSDLWAAAVVLFTMVSGHPPFNAPVESDFYFQRLINTPELFWDLMDSK